MSKKNSLPLDLFDKESIKTATVDLAKMIEERKRELVELEQKYAQLRIWAGYQDSTAYLRLSGGCQGCAMAPVTLTQGIEVAITEAAPEITRVVDVTDHASGTNPYFEAAKK